MRTKTTWRQCRLESSVLFILLITLVSSAGGWPGRSGVLKNNCACLSHVRHIDGYAQLVIPAKAGIQAVLDVIAEPKPGHALSRGISFRCVDYVVEPTWIPAFAGMTNLD